MQPMVSIIVPVYNTGQYLEKCLDSVLNQTYTNLQIILVDDGSTDGTSAMCDRIKSKDSRIEVIHKTNEGLGYTRNKGLEYAVGDYVTFLDSDDWFDIDHIANLVQAAKAFNADLTIGSRTRYNENKEEQYKKIELPIYGNYEGRSVIEKVLPEFVAASPKSKQDLGLPASVCFSLYRTSLIIKNNINFPSERYCVSEDFFFNYRYMLKSIRVTIIQEYGYMYRNNPVSISHTFNSAQLDRVYNFYREVQELTSLENITEDVRMRVHRCGFSKVRSLLIRVISSSLSFKEKVRYIKRIISVDPTQNMLKRINCREYRLPIRVFALLVKHKNYLLVYLLLKVKSRS